MKKQDEIGGDTAKINDGGPAYPRITQKWINPNDPSIEQCEGPDGMSLRDYFAAKAAPSMLGPLYGRDGIHRMAAEACYRFADAMIAARAKASEQQ